MRLESIKSEVGALSSTSNSHAKALVHSSEALHSLGSVYIPSICLTVNLPWQTLHLKVSRQHIGDLITLSGTAKPMPNLSQTSMNKNKRYIEVSALQHQKDQERSMGGNLLTFSNLDYQAVKAIHDEPDLFRLLIASLCPAIYGHEIVKAGLLLSLFGGTQRNGSGLIELSRRSDINMLMVGDPGIGKSQMLKIILEVAPKAVYVCGTGSTVAGLTVSLTKDRHGDDYSLEAGALVIANDGVCCIDEFDKMSDQHNALLETMEQQCVSVAKSGAKKDLPARTTVIAAANPVGGHYDQTKTVCENIKIKPPVLSRFDLVFILLDSPNKEFDKGLMELKNVLRRRRGTTATTSTIANSPKQDPRVDLESQKLIDRVRIRPGTVMDLIPHDFLRKYIAYAKQYVHPRLSNEACEVLKSCYLNLRDVRRAGNQTPLTARQLESLKRLAEARAKLELREIVTKQDAHDAVEIFEYCLTSAIDDEVRATSALSISVLLDTSIRGGGKKANSTNAQAKQLLKTLQAHATKECRNVFTFGELKDFIRMLGFWERTEALIEALNNEGVLLSQGAKGYKLVISDF